MSVEVIKREFHFNNVVLPDPMPSLSLEEVARHYSGVYPEMVNATVIENEDNDPLEGVLKYDIVAKAGTKG